VYRFHLPPSLWTFYGRLSRAGELTRLGRKRGTGPIDPVAFQLSLLMGMYVCMGYGWIIHCRKNMRHQESHETPLLASNVRPSNALWTGH